MTKTQNKTLNHYYIHYFSKETFNEILASKKIPSLNLPTSLMIEPIQYFDAYTFRCAFLERDLYFKDDYDLFVIDTEQGWRYVGANALSSRTYYNDFMSKNNGVFTFNGITYFKLLDIREMPGNEVEFYLKQITNITHVQKKAIFMIMPFHDKILSEFYKINIQDYLKEEMDMNVIRADDFTDNDVIIETIYKEIEKAEIIICEITNCNKNVFYEIGYAKGINKELIFIAQRGKSLNFFDVNHIRRIDYELNEPIEFRAKLKDTITNIKNRNI